MTKSSWSSDFGLHYYWTAGQNISGNYSEINVSVYLWLGRYSSLAIGNRIGTLNIAGANRSVYIPAVNNYSNGTDREVFLCSGTQIVHHDDYGNLNDVYIYLDYPIQATINGIYRQAIYAGACNTGPINSIPRASDLTSNTNFTIEDPFYVRINRANDSFTHIFKMSINNTEFKVIPNIGTSYDIQFSDDEIDQLYEITKNTSQIAMKLTLETYSGSNLLGSKQYNGIIYVNENLNRPDITDFTFEPLDDGTKELTGWTTPINVDNHLSIKGKTKYKITCNSAVAKNKATIKTYELTLNKVKTVSSSTVIESENAIAYDDYLTVVVTDSRGFKITIQKKITAQNYENIVVKEFSLERLKYPNNEKVVLSFKGKFTKTSTLDNFANAFYRYAENNTDLSGTWIPLDIEINDTEFTGNITLSGFELNKIYNFQLRLDDYYNNLIVNGQILKDKPVFFIGEDFVAVNGVEILSYEIIDEW